MKKILLIAAVASFAMTSCKKDYTCQCVDKDGAETIAYTAKLKKKDANNWCDTWNTGVAASGGKCTLK
jgi:hypothetical protein